MTVEPGGRLYKALVETKKATAVDDFVYTGYDPGFAMFLAQVPENDSIDAARDAMLQTIEGVKPAADHRGRARSRARQGAQGDRRDHQRSAAPRRRAVGVDRGRRLAPVLPAARPLAQGDAGRRRSRRGAPTSSRPTARSASSFPTRSPIARRRRRPSTSRRWSRTTRAIRRSPPAKPSMRRRPISTRARSASRSPTA